MPYKHIAARLRKTELACRLHYHQLSHGSNRRRRTTSVSSASSFGRSPVVPASIPSPVHESQYRSNSPPGSSGSHRTASPAGIQLPPVSTGGHSPRLPTILPKPASMSMALSDAVISSPGFSYSTTLPMPHTLPPPSLPSAYMPQAARTASDTVSATPSLRLDCSVPPRTGHQIDMARLHVIYSAHRASFWATIAAEYGGDVSPIVLEQAWKSGVACPFTPATSPDGDFTRKASSGDKTSISAILGIDANPRSPNEREIVRRIEEERMSS